MSRRIITHLLRPVLGWIFIILGIVGLVLPVLQGILFLIIGLMLLSSRYAFAHAFLEKARRRYPNEYEHMLRMKNRIRNNNTLLLTGMMAIVGLSVLTVYLIVTFVRRTAFPS